MISLRVIAGIATGIALAAFALGSARLGALSDAPHASPPAAAAPVFPAFAPPPAPLPARAAAPHPAPARAPAAAAGPARAHVAAGVLARVASARKQEREATCAEPPPAPPADGVESIEIDWNAPPSEP